MTTPEKWVRLLLKHSQSYLSNLTTEKEAIYIRHNMQISRSDSSHGSCRFDDEQDIDHAW